MVRLLLALIFVTTSLSSIIGTPSSIAIQRVGAPSPQQLPNAQTNNLSLGSSTPSSTNSALNSIQIMKSLLTQKYQDVMDGKSSPQDLIATNKDANQDSKQQVKDTMKEYQQQLISQYNASQNKTTANSSGDNIDNGLNNSIRGTQNIIYEGNSNSIDGKANRVNGSNNVIGGQGSLVHGSGNVVMSMPSDLPLPPMPQFPGKDLFVKPVIEKQVGKAEIKGEVKESIDQSNPQNNSPQNNNEEPLQKTVQPQGTFSTEEEPAQGGTEVHADSSVVSPKEHIEGVKSSSGTTQTAQISTVVVNGDNSSTVKNSWGVHVILSTLLLLLLLL